MTTKTKPEPKPTPLEEAQEADKLDFWEEWGALGPGRQVAVCREPGRIWLAMIPLNEDFGPELVKDRWGGGKYSFRARENGKFTTGMPIQHIEIEGAPKLQLPQVVEDTPEVMELRKKLEELTGGEPHSNGDAASNSVMVAVVGMMAPLLTAIVTQAMDRPAQMNPMDILDFARKISKDARRDSNGDGGAMDPIKDLGVPLLSYLTRTETRQIEASKNGKSADNATEPEPNSATPVEPEAARVPSVPKTMQELADFVAHWCAPHVARGGDPALRAEVLLEDLALQNPELLAQVINLARLDDVLDHWSRMVPAVAAAKEWHGTFISEVRRFADESPEGVDSPPDPERGPGDTGDGGDDGTPSEEGGEG